MNKWTIREKFRIVQEISSSTFSRLVELENLRTKKRLAAKYVEFGNIPNHDRIKQESMFMSIVTGQVGFPKFYSFQEETDLSIILMELYGKSLSTLFHENSHSFSLKTVLIIAIQLLNSLEYLHNRSIVHRDIKPENIVIGLGSNYNQFILVDYGLSLFYRDVNTHEIDPMVQQSTFIGTSRYASINTHLGLSPSPRDDLESLAYMLIYFLKGSLPWQKVSGNYLAGIKGFKRRISPEELCVGLIPEFAIFLNEVQQLPYEIVPNYSQYRSLFINAFIQNNFLYDCNYDWRTKILFSFSFPPPEQQKPKLPEKRRPLETTRSMTSIPIIPSRPRGRARGLPHAKSKAFFKQ